MSSVANALKLYFLLQSRGKMKAKDIATELEVDERSVRRYRDELEQAGIYIDSQPGMYGGYYLYNDNHLLGLNLTNEEYFTFLMIKEELEKSNHVALKDFNFALTKIQQAHSYQEVNKDSFEHFNFISKGIKSNIDISKERKKLIDIHTAVLTRNKVLISYTSLSSGLTQRIVRPYATIQYKGDMYFTGYCESRKAIKDFKLCRISEYRIIDEKFLPDESFDINEYMKNCLGIFKDREIRIKLKIYHPMSQIVKEKIWVENQKIIENEKDKSIIFEATMKGVQEIKSWILGMGKNVRVLKPKFLVEEIKNEIKNMKQIY